MKVKPSLSLMLVAVVILMLSGASMAFAQGYPAGGYYPEPTVACNGAGIPQSIGCNGYGANAGYGQQGYYPQQGGQIIRPGVGYNPCTLVGTLAGGTIGSFANHHRLQAVILGALAGGTLGSMLCTNSAGQVVQYQQFQQGGYQQRPQPSQAINVLTRCNFGDDVVGYTYEGKVGCDKLAAKMTQVVASVVPQQQSQPQVAQPTAPQTPKEEASATGCGVKLAGVLIREITPKAGSTCAVDKKAFVDLFMKECHNKGGSDAADIACGRKLDI